MKYLKERTEIATAINYHKYPTIKIDFANVTDYGVQGSKCLVDCGEWLQESEFYIYNDAKILQVSAGGCCIHKDFSYYDVKEMLDKRNLPIIHADEDILIVPIDSSLQEAYAPFIIHTGKIDRFCMAPISLEKVDMTPYLNVTKMSLPRLSKDEAKAIRRLLQASHLCGWFRLDEPLPDQYNIYCRQTDSHMNLRKWLVEANGLGTVDFWNEEEMKALGLDDDEIKLLIDIKDGFAKLRVGY